MDLYVILRRNGFYPEALSAFRRSAEINPRAIASLSKPRPSDRVAETAADTERVAALERELAAGLSPGEAGTAAWQRSCANAHRGAKEHPGGHSPTPTATPGMPWSARGRRTSGMAPTSARVYGCRGRPITSSTGPCSTTRPAYMTAIRSAIRATTARSWET